MSINDALDQLNYARTRINHTRQMLDNIDASVDKIRTDPLTNNDPINSNLLFINKLTDNIRFKLNDIDNRLADSIGLKGEA